MAQNCTLYCTTGSAEKFIRLANDVSGRRVKADDEKQTWQQMVYQFKDCKMTINRMDSDDADNKLAELKKATQSFVQSINTESKDNQIALANAIGQTQQVLAVTVEPEFDELSEDIVFSLLEAGEGVLFTGNEFLNIQGGLVLDIEGNSEEGLLTPNN
jgi:hypothetical protein